MRRKLLACAVVLLSLSGCGKKQTTAHDLASALRQVVSTSAEAEVFLQKVASGSIPDAFAKTHAAYLAEQAKESREDLQNAEPAPGLEEAFARCREEQRQLASVLDGLPQALHDAAAREQIERSLKQMRLQSAQLRDAL